MEARLLDSLHYKLDDLEGKIRAYRGDLIADFQHHYHDLLGDVDPGVASSIERAIVTSFANYPTLRPELKAADSRPTQDSPRPAAFQQSLTPVAVSSRIEAPESSRDRESELQGLFTPSYLPLLDSSPPNVRPTISVATTTAPQTTTTIPFPLLPETGHSSAGTGTDAGNGMVMDGHSEPGGAPPATAQAAAETGSLARATTDDSTSSVCSDKSDIKVRRSALRRSSSLSKPPQSPRRVRFEFMGAEVLPTASPQPADFIAPSALSSYPEDDSISSDTILGDDIEEYEPPPRKSSSTEALRALSRAPMDEGTVWTVVNPDADEIVSQQQDMATPLAKLGSMEKIAPTTADADPKTSAKSLGGNRTKYSGIGGAPNEPDENQDVDNSSDEEDFLAMGKSKSFTKKIVSTPMPRLPTTEKGNGYSTTTPPTNNGTKEAKYHVTSDDDERVDDYDDMFHFEPGGLSAPPKPRQQPSPIPDEPSDDESHEATSPKTQSKPTLYSTSPAVSITRPSRMDPLTPTMARFQPGSLGSYKGRPVIMPVVKDPEVHARAASLGQFNTFVGGLDGRSGMDEGDLSSFRASVVQSGFNGTPRSFTERYMMEEAQAERERNQGTTQ